MVEISRKPLGSAFHPVEASTGLAIGAVAGGATAALLGVTSLVASALFPLAGAIACALYMGLFLRRDAQA